MDNISNLFKNLNSRLSSPFFFSFLISWCIFNWQIIIALLFYKHSEIKLDGYHSYIDLIIRHSSIFNNIVWPLAWAFTYTFVYPMLKNIIDISDAWSVNWGSKWIHKAGKTSKVSMSKYLELREITEERTKALEGIIEKESLYLHQSESLRSEVIKLNEENNDIRRKLSNWEQIQDVSIISGIWELHYITIISKEKIVEKLSINGSTVDYYENSFSGTIHNFCQNIDSTYIKFVLDKNNKSNETTEIILFSLDGLDNYKQLKGRMKSQDYDINVTFKKIR